MSGFRIPEIVLGALLATAVFAAVFAVFPYLAAGPREGLWSWMVHDAAGFFTALVALIALGQLLVFAWQLSLIRRTLGPAQAAASAARDNAQALIDGQRARLFVVVTDESFVSTLRQASAYDHPTSAEMRVGKCVLKYAFKNYGKTPALIHMIGHRSMVVDDLPKEREYSMLTPLPVDHVLGPDDRTVEIEVNLPTMNVGVTRSITHLDKTFWFYGYVVYDDTFGNQWQLDFVWHYSAVSNGFRTFSYKETQQART
jgi:hypothetical protein